MNVRIVPYTAIIIVALFAGISSCRLPDRITLIGGIIHAETITLTAGTSGEVTRITKAPGDRVKKDELLLRLDVTDSAGELTRARRDLADATEREKIAKEELDRTIAEISYSRSRYLTFSYLLKRGAVAPKEVERLRDEWEFAEDQNKRAAIVYERAEMELAEARDDLTRTEAEYGSVFVLAPADGFLTRLMTWEGGYLLKGEETLVVAPEGEIYFTGALEGNRPICLGEEAAVLPLAIPTGTIAGYVAAITDGGREGAPSRIVTVRLFPKSKRDVANIGKPACGVLYRE